MMQANWTIEETGSGKAEVLVGPGDKERRIEASINLDAADVDTEVVRQKARELAELLNRLEELAKAHGMLAKAHGMLSIHEYVRTRTIPEAVPEEEVAGRGAVGALNVFLRSGGKALRLCGIPGYLRGVDVPLEPRTNRFEWAMALLSADGANVRVCLRWAPPPKEAPPSADGFVRELSLEGGRKLSPKKKTR